MNKYYAISYKLYTVLGDNRTLAEEAPTSDPFIFITGFGTTIPGFESHIENLEKGDTFDFTLPKSEAAGDYYPERVLMVDKAIFNVEGKFDSTNVFVGAIIDLQNADGNLFKAQVIDITEDKVRVDLNHPFAGKDLNFVGQVEECHEATNAEIQTLINSLSGGGCHGGCGGCGKGDSGCEGNCNGGCDDGCGC